MVWVPETAEQLEAGLDDGSLPHEHAYYEYKEQLPARNKALDIAIDVCAMTVDGGVLIYGVHEDKPTATFSPSPILLQDAQERISNTVNANVVDRPLFDVHLLQLPKDPSRGYVVVTVPASVLAPHMVESRDERRYYGRVPGGNQRLGHREVERLWQRQRDAQVSRTSVLDEAIANAPSAPLPGQRGDIHLVARPALSASTLLRQQFATADGEILRRPVLEAAHALPFADPWSPHFAEVAQYSQARRSRTGLGLVRQALDAQTGSPTTTDAVLEAQFDGTVTFYHSEIVAAEVRTQGFLQGAGSDYIYAVREPAVAQIAAVFSLFVGRLLTKAGYVGPVDVFLAVTATRGAPSTQWYGSPLNRSVFRLDQPSLDEDDYRDDLQILADRMVSDPGSVARQLTDDMRRVLRPPPVADVLLLKGE